MLMVLFTAIFATISIIEDRREGFLQGALVAPIPRLAIVAGKVIGGTAISLIQAAAFLALGLAILGCSGGGCSIAHLAATFVLLAISGVALTSLGVVIAWRMDSTQGFHAVMSLVLMPLWLLSGAFFPIPSPEGAPSQVVLHWGMRLNPLSYPVAAVRRLLVADAASMLDPALFFLPSLATSIVVTLVFAIVMLLWAWRVSLKSVSGDWI